MARRYTPPTAILSRYIRIPGTAGRYRDTATGLPISRRQYGNIRATHAGWSSWSEYQTTEKRLGNALHNPDSITSLQYLHFLETTRELHGWDFRTTLSTTQDKHAFESGFLAYLNDRDNNKPNGPLAQLLEWIGLREPGASYNVGDTPRA